jgi:hypothetical protein
MFWQMRDTADKLHDKQPKALFMRKGSMSMDIVNYGLREKHDQLKKFGYKLCDIKNLIDWDRLTLDIDNLYMNNTE